MINIALADIAFKRKKTESMAADIRRFDEYQNKLFAYYWLVEETNTQYLAFMADALCPTMSVPIVFCRNLLPRRRHLPVLLRLLSLLLLLLK